MGHYDADYEAEDDRRRKEEKAAIKKSRGVLKTSLDEAFASVKAVHDDIKSGANFPPGPLVPKRFARRVEDALGTIEDLLNWIKGNEP